MAATVKLFMIEDGLLTSTIWCNSSVTQACPYLVVLPSETSLKRSRHPVRVQSWSLKCSQNTKSTFKQAISVLRSQHSVQSVQKSTNFPLGNCTGSEGFFFVYRNWIRGQGLRLPTHVSTAGRGGTGLEAESTNKGKDQTQFREGGVSRPFLAAQPYLSGFHESIREVDVPSFQIASGQHRKQLMMALLQTTGEEQSPKVDVILSPFVRRSSQILPVTACARFLPC